MGREAVSYTHLDVYKRQGRAWAPLWVVDFPMFEHDEENDRWAALHHPFTAPKDGHEDLLTTNPGAALSKAYDMVLNGWEVGGGSVRVHKQEVQSKVFDALKISKEEAQEGSQGRSREAVSYTHLDVYKRQNRDRRSSRVRCR